MKTGVVLEIEKGTAVVLDGSGVFRTVAAHPDWRTGDVVHLFQKQRRTQWALPFCACLALILASTGGWLWMAPAALVSLDVNPSVELTLNRFDRVVSVRGMNEEGVVLLEGGNVKGMAAGAAVSALLDSGQMGPYLARENYVTLTVQSNDAALEERLLVLVNQTASAAVGDGTRVACHIVDGALVEAAHGCGVTAGKYLALLGLQAADPDIDITEYTHCGIGEIEAQTARCHAAGSGMGITEPEDTSPGCGRSNGHGHRHHHRKRWVNKVPAL